MAKERLSISIDQEIAKKFRDLAKRQTRRLNDEFVYLLNEELEREKRKEQKYGMDQFDSAQRADSQGG